MKLDTKERLILANQFKILEQLYPGEASSYKEYRTALEDGFSLHYEEIVESFGDEMSEEECKEVLEILSMYRAITFSNKKLNKTKRVERPRLKFDGFDGNNESKQFSYVRYLIFDLDRFDELKNDANHPSSLNSHSPRLLKYRKMLKVWKNLHSSCELSSEEILSILEA